MNKPVRGTPPRRSKNVKLAAFGGAFLALGGVLGAVVTHIFEQMEVGKVVQPVGADIAHVVAKDRLRVVLDADPRVIREGELVRIQAVITGMVVEEQGGFVEILCESDALLERAGDTRIAIPKSATAIFLSPVYCRGIHPGVATISARVTVDMPVDVDAARINIVHAERTDQPTSGNLSGEWSLMLGAELGQMWISHHGSAVGGDYMTDGNKRGAIAGIVDGNKFVVKLLDARQGSGFAVDGNLGGAGGQLEITGNADRVVSRGGHWEVVPGHPERFVATTGGPGRRGSIRMVEPAGAQPR